MTQNTEISPQDVDFEIIGDVLGTGATHNIALNTAEKRRVVIDGELNSLRDLYVLIRDDFDSTSSKHGEDYQSRLNAYQSKTSAHKRLLKKTDKPVIKTSLAQFKQDGVVKNVTDGAKALEKSVKAVRGKLSGSLADKVRRRSVSDDVVREQIQVLEEDLNVSKDDIYHSAQAFGRNLADRSQAMADKPALKDSAEAVNMASESLDVLGNPMQEKLSQMSFCQTRLNNVAAVLGLESVQLKETQEVVVKGEFQWALESITAPEIETRLSGKFAFMARFNAAEKAVEGLIKELNGKLAGASAQNVASQGTGEHTPDSATLPEPPAIGENPPPRARVF